MAKERKAKELEVDELHTLAVTKAILEDTSDGVVFVVKTQDTEDGKSIKAEVNFAARNIPTEVLVRMKKHLQTVIDEKQNEDKKSIPFEDMMKNLFGGKK